MLVEFSWLSVSRQLACRRCRFHAPKLDLWLPDCKCCQSLQLFRLRSHAKGALPTLRTSMGPLWISWKQRSARSKELLAAHGWETRPREKFFKDFSQCRLLDLLLQTSARFNTAFVSSSKILAKPLAVGTQTPQSSGCLAIQCT